MLLTQSQLEDKIREFAAVIDAPEVFIPTFGSSNQTGLPHIEIHDDHYELIVCEKGEELSRESFKNADILVLKVLQDISYAMACDLDFDGTEAKNFRDRFLEAQQHLMSKIYAYYRENVKPKKVPKATEDNTALSASRKKILAKSKLHKKPVPTKEGKAVRKKAT